MVGTHPAEIAEPRVYFIIKVDGAHLSWILIKQCTNMVPKTGFSYKGCTFHHIMHRFTCVTNHNWTGGKSIYC
uniref:PPIase cyclophilin-type domain-containing protein n=1 Tax=Maylandia zebra TaxID=106582 RepID=A0A3P9BEX7_9CICH